jgi:hypothetical protein
MMAFQDILVIPAEAGISGDMSARLPHETPASAGAPLLGEKLRA